MHSHMIYLTKMKVAFVLAAFLVAHATAHLCLIYPHQCGSAQGLDKAGKTVRVCIILVVHQNIIYLHGSALASYVHVLLLHRSVAKGGPGGARAPPSVAKVGPGSPTFLRLCPYFAFDTR